MLVLKKNGILLAAMLAFLLFVSGCQLFSAPYEYKGAVLDPPLAVPDFELTDTAGQPFHLSEVEADLTLIYFGYTYCPDVCPLTLADVKQALAGVENRDEVQLVFISVDPDRDTPEVLERYLAAFDPQFIGLTDDFEKVQEMMKPYGAYAEKEEVTDSAAGYLVSHTARLYLVDADRNILLTYPFGFEPEDLKSDLNHLLQQEQ
jgi:protein SCO1/2